MKKSVIEIEIVELPGNDGYEARIPKLGGATYRGCGDSEKEALESLGLVMSDIEAKRKCENCIFWKQISEYMGRCLWIRTTSKDEYADISAKTRYDFWCCKFEERKGSRK